MLIFVKVSTPPLDLKKMSGFTENMKNVFEQK